MALCRLTEAVELTDLTLRVSECWSFLLWLDRWWGFALGSLLSRWTITSANYVGDGPGEGDQCSNVPTFLWWMSGFWL